MSGLTGVRAWFDAARSADETTARREAAVIASRPQRTGVTRTRELALYRPPPSLIDHLPWVEAIEPEGTILLDDGRSVGRVFELSPVGTEGRPDSLIVELRDGIQDALQESFAERDRGPWVWQTFTAYESDLGPAAEIFERYGRGHDDNYSAAFSRLYQAHLQGLAKGGFLDQAVTRANWQARRLRTVACLYRRVPVSDRSDPLGALDRASARLERALAGQGVGLIPMTGLRFHRFVLRFFNDAGTVDELALDRADALPFGDGFAESLFHACPISDAPSGCFHFGKRFARTLAIEGFRRRPLPGLLTAERAHGDAVTTLMDQLPQGSVLATTLVAAAQDTVATHVAGVVRAAIGDATDAKRTRTDGQRIQETLSTDQKLYRASQVLYLTADNQAELDQQSVAARAVLMSAGLKVLEPGHDVRALDRFLIHLPLAYRADLDEASGWRTARLNWVQHLASLSPALGRSTGSGHPGLTFFNRGGEPLTFDPLNPADRRKNAHLLLVGPTGAGKSATLAAMLAQTLAVHRPRLFILEAGNSFELVARWWQSQGLSVNRLALRPGAGVSLAPFAQAAQLVGEHTQTPDLADNPFGIAEQELDGGRDFLGELEIIATLMITGGEAKETERLSRADRGRIREAILTAARAAQAAGVACRLEHLQQGFRALAKENRRGEAERARLADKAQAIGLFRHGFAGEIFDGEGQPFTDADVTLVDLGHFAREGYEAHLAIAVIALLNTVYQRAEATQHEARETIVAIDEAHLITTHPLLSPYLVKIGKMFRKLGAWLWLATQNLEDFPGSARRLLNMIEWWLALVMPKEEITAVERFKSLTPEQRSLLQSATKENGKYTEGVLLTRQRNLLFRAVPPSLILALTQTEKHEKAKRAALMREHGIDELEAVHRVAAAIDRSRGHET